MAFYVGQSLTLSVEFTKLVNPFTSHTHAYDPATPSIRVKPPTGDTETFTPASTPAVVQQLDDATGMIPQVGQWKVDYVPSVAGIHLYAGFDPDATVPGQAYGSFRVERPPIDVT